MAECPVPGAWPPDPHPNFSTVHSKQLYLPLKSTLVKNRGRGGRLLLTRFPMKEICPEEHRDEGLLLALGTQQWDLSPGPDSMGTFGRADVPTFRRSDEVARGL